MDDTAPVSFDVLANRDQKHTWLKNKYYNILTYGG